MKLSIVTTMYNSENYLAEFTQRCCAAAEQVVGDDYEMIFVNDGSPDNSLAQAVSLLDKNPHIKVVDLSRNFGHHKAMMAGLQHSSGDYIFLIDCDLEENPEWLVPFFDELQSDDLPLIDVVYGVQKKREGSIFEKISGELFYYIFRKTSRVKIPRNLMTVRLMSNRYVQALLLHKETEIFMAGLLSTTGFRQKPISLSKRKKAGSAYNLRRKIDLAATSIISFSSAPLKFLCLFGLLIVFLSICVSIYLLSLHLSSRIILQGWTSVMLSLWFFGGLTLFSIGMVGIYIDKIFSEVKQRPNYIVRDLYGFKKPK